MAAHTHTMHLQGFGPFVPLCHLTFSPFISGHLKSVAEETALKQLLELDISCLGVET